MGYYNEGHTDGCRCNVDCPGCDEEIRREFQNWLRDQAGE